jgi:hypothetical protein
MIELQEVEKLFTAALADFAVGRDGLELQPSARKGGRFAAYIANPTAELRSPLAPSALRSGGSDIICQLFDMAGEGDSICCPCCPATPCI